MKPSTPLRTIKKKLPIFYKAQQKVIFILFYTLIFIFWIYPFQRPSAVSWDTYKIWSWLYMSMYFYSHCLSSRLTGWFKKMDSIEQ